MRQGSAVLLFLIGVSAVPGCGADSTTPAPDARANSVDAPSNATTPTRPVLHAGADDDAHADTGVRADAPPANAVAPDADAPVDDSEPELFRQLDAAFARPGEVKDGVYRLVTPRPDLLVTVDGMDVPTGAFLESDFRFWRCPCGKLLVNGQFVLADYEANDVVDELHTGKLHVASIAPVLLHEQPRLLMVRFQGEGRAPELAQALKSALSYTGEARNAPQPVDLSPPHD